MVATLCTYINVKLEGAGEGVELTTRIHGNLIVRSVPGVEVFFVLGVLRVEILIVRKQGLKGI